MTNWLSYCLNCLAGCLSGCVVDWVDACVIGCLAHRMAAWLSGCLAHRMGCLAEWLSCSSNGLSGWVAVSLIEWLHVWVVAWLSGCLSGCVANWVAVWRAEPDLYTYGLDGRRAGWPTDPWVLYWGNRKKPHGSTTSKSLTSCYVSHFGRRGIIRRQRREASSVVFHTVHPWSQYDRRTQKFTVKWYSLISS
jgi:hypothetical protein